ILFSFCGPYRPTSPSCLPFLFFFFNDPAPTEIYTLSLHDALPIYGTLDFVGYPRFPAPVEFIAAVIAYYVHPVNIQTACLIMEGAEFTENIINGVERPVNNVFRKFSAFHDETGRLNVDEIGRAVQQECRDRYRM